MLQDRKKIVIEGDEIVAREYKLLKLQRYLVSPPITDPITTASLPGQHKVRDHWF